ncbi:MAG: acyl-CoA-binding protein [Wenzhouxiangellaceae bacterium]
MSEELNSRFEQAQQDVKKLPEKPDNDTLLRLYALYKQGTEGDVQGDRPGLFDFVGGAKYDAWAKLQGTSQDEAKQKYINLVERLTG